LFGAPDASNKDAIPEATLRAWSSKPGIHWHGWSADVARVWREHHVALLLTNYREGLPRSLIEAAASGRPIVTTQTAGCRELVRDGKEGFLVPPGDIDAAVDALSRLAADDGLRARMGAAAHAHFLEKFTEQAVTSKVADTYRALVGTS
jgi:glycosyltransferase involved in cell wall biosynthesis